MNIVFEKLLAHCLKVYSGKTERHGLPYILHPMAVVSAVDTLPEKIVALAHDYGEFRDPEELASLGVPHELIGKIKLLTKHFSGDVRENDPGYCSMIRQLIADPVCRKVKYTDLLVNRSHEDSPGEKGYFTGSFPHAAALLADAEEGRIYFKSSSLYFNVFSNFYPVELEIGGRVWKSAEHFYQASKFSPSDGVSPSKSIFEAICDAETPAEAKFIADSNFSCDNRRLWARTSRRYNAVARMLNAKFAPGTDMRRLLCQTGTLELIHESCSDLFWGQNRKGAGRNLLGNALMQMRDSGGECSALLIMASAWEDEAEQANDL